MTTFDLWRMGLVDTKDLYLEAHYRAQRINDTREIREDRLRRHEERTK